MSNISNAGALEMLVIGRWLKFSILASVVITLTVAHAAGNFQTLNLASTALATGKKAPHDLQIDDDIGKLPMPVAEMREALLDAALRGDIDALVEPIQMNELKPDFGEIDTAKPIESWKKLSIDGEGREILAVLIDILQSPYAIVRQGTDIENDKLYIWPYFAEVPIDKLPPHLEVQLLRLIPREDYKIAKQTGEYKFWRLSIGADGTWHSFRK